MSDTAIKKHLNEQDVEQENDDLIIKSLDNKSALSNEKINEEIIISMDKATGEKQETEEQKKDVQYVSHPMKSLAIGKVVVNITVGQSGEPLERAMTILESLSGQKPSTRRAKQTIRTFGIRRNEPISCIVTIRGSKAKEFLTKTFPAVGNKLNIRSFDKNGNFAFGIREHIDIPGQRYNPNLGIIGMDVMATVERPGYRISRKKRGRSKVGVKHRVTREQSIEFINKSFGVEVGLPSE
jgi:large subunit ribosomal protein L5